MDLNIENKIAVLLSIRYKTFFKPSQISIKVHLQQINQKHESPSQMKKKNDIKITLSSFDRVQGFDQWTVIQQHP